MKGLETALMWVGFGTAVVFAMIMLCLDYHYVNVPVAQSLNTGKYIILKEDTLRVNGMTIKRIYYREK